MGEEEKVFRFLSDAEFQGQASNFAVCYAFALGYRDPDSGGYHGPWQYPAATRPILADGPPPDHTSNSINQITGSAMATAIHATGKNAPATIPAIVTAIAIIQQP